MANCCAKRPGGSTTVGELRNGIEVLGRELVSAEPGFAAPVHEYEVLFSARAKIETKAGKSTFAGVEINGKRVTHVMTIQFTNLEIDTRNRIRDARGFLFAILGVENVDEANRWIKLYCVPAGDETKDAAR
jgi:hypothetical protein